MQERNNPADRRSTAERIRLITEVGLPDFPFRLDQRSPLLMLGSCFTDEIGRMLHKFLFPVCVNPFGVTYNPASVMAGLQSLAGKEAYAEEDLDHHNGLWFSFDHYTRFSDADKVQALERINRKFLEAKEMLSMASVLVITWGTAWVYRHREKQRVVNNCHKLPAGTFNRERMTPGQVIERYTPFLESLFNRHPGLKVLFTVSPVRHWKDGAHGNQLSKATLLLAADDLIHRFPDRCFYFPSYELVMDEMRDYRFYGSDLVHTNETATRYIWEKFSQSLLTGEARQIIRELDPLLKLKAHRPIRSEESNRVHLEEKRIAMERTLKAKYPHLAWSNWEIPNI